MPEAQDIVDVVVGAKGSTSDISLFRSHLSKFAVKQLFKGDQAYVGGKNIATPHKKPRNRELTGEQKVENKVFSSHQIFIEHLIRLIKTFGLHLKGFDFTLRCTSK